MAEARGLKRSTIVGHLCVALKLGLLAEDCLQVADDVRYRVESVLASQQLDSNVSRLGPIKAACDEIEETSYEDIKVVVTTLSMKHGVKDNKLQWEKKEEEKRREGMQEETPPPLKRKATLTNVNGAKKIKSNSLFK